MGGYPPGTSRRDLVKGGIIEPHNHDHRWGPADRAQPLLEDGAAIFFEECQYVEGEYGQGWECEEERSYRFEYSTLSYGEQEWELPTSHSGWQDVPSTLEAAVVIIEETFHANGPSDIISMDVDPDPDGGEVVLGYEGWELTYEP